MVANVWRSRQWKRSTPLARRRGSPSQLSMTLAAAPGGWTRPSRICSPTTPRWRYQGWATWSRQGAFVLYLKGSTRGAHFLFLCPLNQLSLYNKGLGLIWFSTRWAFFLIRLSLYQHMFTYLSNPTSITYFLKLLNECDDLIHISSFLGVQYWHAKIFGETSFAWEQLLHTDLLRQNFMNYKKSSKNPKV